MVAELDGSGNAIRTYGWLGKSGGLLWVKDSGGEYYVPSFDGNGNVTKLIKWSDRTIAAGLRLRPGFPRERVVGEELSLAQSAGALQRLSVAMVVLSRGEGELVRADGPMAKANPFRFSTKYQDDESDFLYYGYRYLANGRWLNRDPIEESGGLNLYAFVGNDGVNLVDPNGLWGVQFGNFNLGYGDPNLAFDSSSFDTSVASGVDWIDYYRESVASATGFGFLGDYDPCDEWLRRMRGLGRSSTLALQVLGPVKLGGWAASGDSLLHTLTGLGVNGYGLYESAGAIESGWDNINAGNPWGFAELGLGLLGAKGNLSGLGGGLKKLNSTLAANYLPGKAVSGQIANPASLFKGGAAEKLHGHHTYPKAIGGHPDQKLADILESTHLGKGGVHSDLAGFEGGWLRPRKGMTGADILAEYGQTAVEDGLRRFYSQPKWSHLLPTYEEAVQFTAKAAGR